MAGRGHHADHRRHAARARARRLAARAAHAARQRTRPPPRARRAAPRPRAAAPPAAHHQSGRAHPCGGVSAPRRPPPSRRRPCAPARSPRRSRRPAARTRPPPRARRAAPRLWAAASRAAHQPGGRYAHSAGVGRLRRTPSLGPPPLARSRARPTPRVSAPSGSSVMLLRRHRRLAPLAHLLHTSRMVEPHTTPYRFCQTFDTERPI
eukprot:5240582-Prymnesium_polylepis.1